METKCWPKSPVLLSALISDGHDPGSPSVSLLNKNQQIKGEKQHSDSHKYASARKLCTNKAKNVKY